MGNDDDFCTPGKGLQAGGCDFCAFGWLYLADFDDVTSSARTKTDCISEPPAVSTLAVFHSDATDQAACRILRKLAALHIYEHANDSPLLSEDCARMYTTKT